MLIENRNALSEFASKRVRVTGFYERSNMMTDYRGQWNKTSLVQDVTVHEDGREVYVGHVWVQQAVGIWAEKPHKGDKIAFSARVSSYSKKLPAPNAEGLSVVLAYNLTNPDQVEVLTEHDDANDDGVEYAFLANSVQVQPQASDPLALIRKVKGVMSEVGADHVRAVLPHLDTLADVVREAGGQEKLIELLTLLS